MINSNKLPLLAVIVVAAVVSTACIVYAHVQNGVQNAAADLEYAASQTAGISTTLAQTVATSDSNTTTTSESANGSGGGGPLGGGGGRPNGGGAAGDSSAPPGRSTTANDGSDAPGDNSTPAADNSNKGGDNSATGIKQQMQDRSEQKSELNNSSGNWSKSNLIYFGICVAAVIMALILVKFYSRRRYSH